VESAVVVDLAAGGSAHKRREVMGWGLHPVGIVVAETVAAAVVATVPAQVGAKEAKAARVVMVA